jgi:hypothetical protein
MDNNNNERSNDGVGNSGSSKVGNPGLVVRMRGIAQTVAAVTESF